jgi:SAM-dependent methyltransferase
LGKEAANVVLFEDKFLYKSGEEVYEAIDMKLEKGIGQCKGIIMSFRCWCGNTELAFFSSEYLHCAVCQTLVSRERAERDINPNTDDNDDFYGQDYWFSYQKHKLGFPDIVTRARADLPERCLHWLHTLLKYKVPPAKALELGSSHGGSVAMLRWAGFDATGLELSPWVVDFSRRTFNVPVLQGYLEDQTLDASSLDVIALMDVLEHLSDPVGTLRSCLNLLKPDGILLIQTPLYPEDKTYEQLRAEGNRFLEQLKAEEHLYLFSERSIKEFFHRLGADHLVFEPAIFAHYDMFLVASRTPLPVHVPDEISEALSATPGGRLVLALLDLRDQMQIQNTVTARQNTQLEAQLAACEADRTARLAIIERQDAEVSELQAQVQRWLQQNQTMTAQLEKSRECQAALASRVDAYAQQLQVITARLQAMHRGLHTLERTRVYRFLHALGRWRFVEPLLAQSRVNPETDL